MTSDTRARAKEIYDGAFLQALQDEADDPQLVAALELAAAAWDEGWNQGFRDYQSRVNDGDGYDVITPTPNPYAAK